MIKLCKCNSGYADYIDLIKDTVGHMVIFMISTLQWK